MFIMWGMMGYENVKLSKHSRGTINCKSTCCAFMMHQYNACGHAGVAILKWLWKLTFIIYMWQ